MGICADSESPLQKFYMTVGVPIFLKDRSNTKFFVMMGTHGEPQVYASHKCMRATNIDYHLECRFSLNILWGTQWIIGTVLTMSRPDFPKGYIPVEHPRRTSP
jgi:hypothetical protein